VLEEELELDVDVVDVEELVLVVLVELEELVELVLVLDEVELVDVLLEVDVVLVELLVLLVLEDVEVVEVELLVVDVDDDELDDDVLVLLDVVDVDDEVLVVEVLLDVEVVDVDELLLVELVDEDVFLGIRITGVTQHVFLRTGAAGIGGAAAGTADFRSFLVRHGHHASQRKRHVSLRRSHHVQMIFAGVGDHAMSRAYQFPFAEPFQLRNERHAFKHDRFAFQFNGGAHNSQLLDDVRSRGTEDRILGAVRQNHFRQGASGFAACPNLAGSHTSGNQSGHAGFSSRSVDVDAGGNLVQIPTMHGRFEETTDGQQTGGS
jgi:hypothetical protein